MLKVPARAIAVLLALASTWAPSAVAQLPDPQSRFNQAVELAKAGEYDKAVGLCQDVLERLPGPERPRVHKLLGYAYKKLEMLPEAWHHLTIYIKASTEEDAAAAGWLQEVETSLERTHVKIRISCQPGNLLLSIPGSKAEAPPLPPVRISGASLVWWFRPGQVRVRAEAPEYQPRTVEIDVREQGDQGFREIRLSAVQSHRIELAEPDGGIAGPAVAKPASRKKPLRALEWTLVGSGLALGVTGAIFHGLGHAKNEDLHSKYSDVAAYPDAAAARSLYKDARRKQVAPKELAAWSLYGIGGAALVAGVVTWVVRKPGRQEKATAFSVTPLALPGGSGALMTIGF